jgi:hypothetical protein
MARLAATHHAAAHHAAAAHHIATAHAVAASHHAAATHHVAAAIAVTATPAVIISVVAAQMVSGIGQSLAEMVPARCRKKNEARESGSDQKHKDCNFRVACHDRKSSVVSPLN